MSFSFRRPMAIFILAVFIVAFAGLAVAKTPAAAPGPGKPDANALAQQPWTVRCDTDSKDPKADKAKTPSHCEVFQRLSVAKTGQRVAEFAVAYTAPDKSTARGVLVLPLGILLTDDLQMQIDNGKAFKFKVRYCTGEGCFAFLDLNQTVINILKGASAINVTAKAFSGQDVVIKLQMAGFSPALAKL